MEPAADEAPSLGELAARPLLSSPLELCYCSDSCGQGRHSPGAFFAPQ